MAGQDPHHPLILLDLCYLRSSLSPKAATLVSLGSLNAAFLTCSTAQPSVKASRAHGRPSPPPFCSSLFQPLQLPWAPVFAPQLSRTTVLSLGPSLLSPSWEIGLRQRAMVTVGSACEFPFSCRLWSCTACCPLPETCARRFCLTLQLVWCQSHRQKRKSHFLFSMWEWENLSHRVNVVKNNR